MWLHVFIEKQKLCSRDVGDTRTDLFIDLSAICGGRRHGRDHTSFRLHCRPPSYPPSLPLFVSTRRSFQQMHEACQSVTFSLATELYDQLLVFHDTQQVVY
jgi:hypothetical protein